MHPEIKSVINVSFSSDNFIENVVYIKTCIFHPQHPLRKHISTLLIINVHMYTFQIVYTRYYMCTCRPDRTVLRNVHFDLRVFNTIRKKI